MTDYRVVTLWRNVAKIALVSLVAAIACGLFTGSLMATVLVGIVAPVVAPMFWDTHTLEPRND